MGTSSLMSRFSVHYRFMVYYLSICLLERFGGNEADMNQQ